MSETNYSNLFINLLNINLTPWLQQKLSEWVELAISNLQVDKLAI